MYSQLAERLSDRVVGERIDCSDDETTHAPAVLDMYPISVPARWSDENFRAQLNEIVGSQTPGQPFVEPSPVDSENNTLYVGCRDHIFLFDAAIEMRFYRRSAGADVVQLKVVGRPKDGSAEWVVPEIDSNGIVTLPGTRITNRWQVISNFVGEDCVFPAAKFVVYAICEKASQQAAEDENTSGFLLRTENDKLTLVGHSLGGAAAQFIANSWPSQVSDVSWPDCPGVDAYAFGSIGLEPPHSGHQPTVRGTLTSYASDCDWVAQSAPFSRRVQAGHLFTLSLTDRHSIDEIQEDLCRCLLHRGNHEFNNYRSPSSPPPNERLCGAQPGGA